ncbi:hypothetical protein BMS81_04265 [Leuconostoc pseudomesenteroides]|nr:hypothetical protein BMS81_04265 [Leuconostoc pseudomesenteroides]
MVNLNDVARKAHVSKMTVSRVINHPDQVSPEVFYTIKCKRLHIMLFQTCVQILMKKIQFYRELFKELVHD